MTPDLPLRPQVLALWRCAIPRYRQLPTWPLSTCTQSGRNCLFLARTVHHCYFPAELLMLPPLCWARSKG